MKYILFAFINKEDLLIVNEIHEDRYLKITAVLAVTTQFVETTNHTL